MSSNFNPGASQLGVLEVMKDRFMFGSHIYKAPLAAGLILLGAVGLLASDKKTSSAPARSAASPTRQAPSRASGGASTVGGANHSGASTHGGPTANGPTASGSVTRTVLLSDLQMVGASGNRVTGEPTHCIKPLQEIPQG